MPQAHDIIEQVFREEYGRIIASLIRLSGSFDLAEESLQEAFSTAVATWERDGTPKNPGAWLTRVAHRKLVDALRRENTTVVKRAELEYETIRLRSADEVLEGRQFNHGQGATEYREHAEMPGAEPFDDSLEYPDDRLRLIFTCCHPALDGKAKVALTLRTLGGLTTGEIARAFLLHEATLAQRLVRAKNKIRIARIPYQVPPREILRDRLTSVQAVVYLIFNEGYAATSGSSLIRQDLCAEAIRLGRLLWELMPHEPENSGLLALMLLQDSRREARISKRGELLTLEAQDRSLWDQKEIEEGLSLVEGALRLRRVGGYQLQAAIAAVHADAKTVGETDWRQIVALYNELMLINPSQVIALNYAAAVAMCDGYEQGLKLAEDAGASGTLDDYYPFHAARADLLRRLNRIHEAQAAYSRALEITTNQVEQEHVRRRLGELRNTET